MLVAYGSPSLNPKPKQQNLQLPVTVKKSLLPKDMANQQPLKDLSHLSPHPLKVPLCAPALRTCAICRQRVKGRVRVYMDEEEG
nr:hypothetical protein BaRGS_002601 [Batillaria attramentaria]